MANGVFDSAKTYVYSIPQRQEQDVIVGLTFLPLIRDDGGITYGANYSLYNGLAKPISNSTTTEEYYASFTFTYPNGSAVNVWFSGPQGNLTNDCGAAVVCQYLPTQQGSSRSPHSNYFQVTAAGNYTIHIVSVCPPGITCTSSIATLSVTRALSLVTYYRPYYISGMETTIVAEVTIAIVVALAILFLGIAGYRISRRKRAQSSHVRTPTSPVVD